MDYLQHIELNDSISILIESVESPCGSCKQTRCHISRMKGGTCLKTREAASSPQLLLVRTEHALEPHKAADVAVKANVEMLVCVSHRYDVVQLVVEMKSFMKRDKKNVGK